MLCVPAGDRERLQYVAAGRPALNHNNPNARIRCRAPDSICHPVGFDATFPSVDFAPLPVKNGKVTLAILVDRSSVEVFGEDGQRTITDQIFPNRDSQGIQVFSTAGEPSSTGSPSGSCSPPGSNRPG